MTALSIEDAREILLDRNVIAVGARGDDERRRRHGTRTTFVRVFEIHTDAVPSSLPSGLSAGEIRLSGKPPSVAAAIASVKAARALAGNIPLTGYALADLLDLVDGNVASLTDLDGRLGAAGLATLSEAPVDAMADPIESVMAARHGGRDVPRLTVRDAAADRLQAIVIARDIQAAVGGVRAFAPLPRVTSIAQPTTGYDDVRQIAVARLLAHNIGSIQVDWPIYGPKLAQVALTMGADDVDGISPLEGDLGRRRSPIEEIRSNITAAGLEPVERTGSWQGR